MKVCCEIFYFHSAQCQCDSMCSKILFKASTHARKNEEEVLWETCAQQLNNYHMTERSHVPRHHGLSEWPCCGNLSFLCKNLISPTGATWDHLNLILKSWIFFRALSKVYKKSSYNLIRLLSYGLINKRC